MVTFGERLRLLRKENNLTQEQLASYFGMKKSRISQYELDKRQADDDFKKQLADFFNVSLDYLLGRTNDKNIIDIPQEYTDKYKVTSKDKKQYLEHMKKANEAFFMNDEFNEEDKKEILDTMNEIFWKAKTMNKRKPKDE